MMPPRPDIGQMKPVIARALPLFAYGTMMDADVLSIVLARDIEWQVYEPARLHGYQRVRLPNESYPTLRPAPGACVPGVVVRNLSATDYERVAFFESEEYELRECTVVTATGASESALFCFEDSAGEASAPWELDWWQHHHKSTHLAVFQAFMALFGQLDTVQADARWEQMMESVVGRTQQTGGR